MAGNMQDYFKSRFEDNLLVKMPEREDDHLTSATRLLEKKREMMEVETALSAQKEEFQMKMESLQQRREELEKKEQQLKESLLKFDRFLKETDAKRVRAVKKATEERSYRRQKEQEIAQVQEDMSVYSELLDRLNKLADKYLAFQRYLERVVEVSDEFTEIREVVDRFETLSSTYQDLKRREQLTQDSIEVCRTQQQAYKEAKANEVLSQNNALSGLQERLEAATSAAMKREAEWTLIKHSVADRTMQIGTVRVASYNLCQLVNKYQGGLHQRHQQMQELDDLATKATGGDIGQVTSDQLTRVQQFVMDLTAVTERVVANKRSATSAAATAAATATAAAETERTMEL
uniref:DUF4200 domain-containing protein n=2 Tax=Macrostomum lignano TaxID=282301 RepID=A0A1I8GLU1_9PLAT